MQEKENVISIDWKLAFAKVAQFGIFVSIAVIAPYFGNQLITGSIVNAILFISATMMGIEYAVMLCLIPSLISIYTGLLSLVLAPIIPFIMIGNVLLVLIYSSLKQKGPIKYASKVGVIPSEQFNGVNFWVGAVPAAFIKFIFIWLMGMILANSILHGIAKNILLMVSWPQLATALIGACIAYIFLKIIHPVK